MKIVILDGFTENPGDLSWDGFRNLGELTVYDRTPDDFDTIVKRIGNNQAVIVNKVKITKKILDACPNIEYIGVLATGFNVVDTVAAAERGIPVCNVPTYGTAAVAQFTFALILECCHHVGHHSDAVKQGRWTNSKDFCFWDYPLTELKGKTLGLVGYGRIGRTVGTIANAFGMHVIVYDKIMSLDSEIAEYADLAELYSRADIVSLHCPLTKDNEKMLDKNAFDMMKDGVIVINTSRGGLIDENALKDALDSGKVSFAAVDVVSEEPIKPDNPLLRADNCIITPHIAWASKESRKRLMDTAVMNLVSYLDGEPINVVNFR